MNASFSLWLVWGETEIKILLRELRTTIPNLERRRGLKSREAARSQSLKIDENFAN